MTNPKAKTKPYGQAFSSQLPSLTLAAFCKTHLTLTVDDHKSQKSVYFSPEEVERLMLEMGEWVKSTIASPVGQTREYGHRETTEAATITVDTSQGFNVTFRIVTDKDLTIGYLNFASVSNLVTQLLAWLDNEVEEAERRND